MKIELQQIKYTYNPGLISEVVALNDINLCVGEAENIALIGSTGSGKSTLIQLFNGLLEPTEGAISFDGVNLYDRLRETEAGARSKKEAKAAAKEAGQKKKAMLRELRKKVGLVFQYPEYQLFDETVVADAAFGPKNLGYSAEEAREKAKTALRSVGISEDLFDKSPFELSGGEMRRVAIAGILAMEPEVLILDEPTAGLDPQGKMEILQIVGKFQKDSGMTVIFVSHNMDEVAEYAERVIAMHQGRIVFDGPVRKAFEEHAYLEEIGLRAPSVTYICEALGIPGVITLKEAADKIAAAQKSGAIVTSDTI